MSGQHVEDCGRFPPMPLQLLLHEMKEANLIKTLRGYLMSNGKRNEGLINFTIFMFFLDLQFNIICADTKF
ncbi:hypothetical protein C0J52_09698 [Blattella germanica]|nr:hypothetical protein C0J52_09698 [Blattella germanica]